MPIKPFLKKLAKVPLQRILSAVERPVRRFAFADIMTPRGVLRSTKDYASTIKFDANQHFQYREKSEVALSAATTWFGGDYFEFGSADLNTFRNMLSAFDIYGLTERFPDTQFFGFDVFGNIESNNDDIKKRLFEKDHGDCSGAYYQEYMRLFQHRGNSYAENMELLKVHGLFLEKCHLVQGYFENTLSPEFKRSLKAEGRQIGFAFLDCNIAPPYKVVFEFIFDLMKEDSYVYMDEYYASAVLRYYREFEEQLLRQRGIASVFVRNAGAFGALFRLYPANVKLEALDLRIWE